MVKIVKNERSWAIDLITIINIFLQSKTLKIKKVGGESTINTGKNTMFPDIILYGDEARTKILQGWEIKLPDTDITNEEFIEDAQRKAEILDLNSCLLWNFSSAVLYVKDSNGEYKIKKQWNETSFIQTREDVQHFENEWKALIEKVIIELNNFLLQDTIIHSRLDNVISDSLMSVIIERNKGLVAEHLNFNRIRNRTLNSFLNIWWREVSEEYLKDETNMSDAFSKYILLNWVNKITFAHSIKEYHSPAKLVEQINKSITPERAIQIFEDISERCDFYNIFKKVEYSEILPENTWLDLTEYNSFLTLNGITSFDQEALQKILENTVRSARREVIGQYTTPELLAELLAKITINDLTGSVLDPCSGTGTIPKSIIKLKKEQLSVKDAFLSVWSSDKFSLPLQISNLNLTDMDSINIPSLIFQSNLFTLEKGINIPITDPSDGNVMNLKLPPFDYILSNLPFVAFEIIDDDEKEYLNTIVHNVEKTYDITLGARSDLYAYMVIKLWELLDVDGVLGIITSNSWLGTNSGKQFYNIITRLYQVDKIIISGKGRWFSNADVVTTILILKKKSSPKYEFKYCTHFYKLDIPLIDLKCDEKMEIISDSILTNKVLNSDYLTLNKYEQDNIKNLLELNISLNSLFHSVDWLLEIKDKLINFKEIFIIKRGERRGWDKLFYPGEDHSIEPQYIEKVLKNSRNLNTLIAIPDNDAFCCSLTKSELKSRKHFGALKWIEKFENEVNGTGKPLPLVLKRSNLHWYEMSNNSTADIVTSLNPDRRLFYAKFEKPSFINQRLIGLKSIKEDVNVDLLHALLNSMLSMFYIEAIGFGRGLGALDINKSSLEKAFILNPLILSKQQTVEIIKAFKPIIEREIYSTEEELTMPDRINFERVVLKAFGLEEYFNKIKYSLLSLQRTRLTARV